MRFVLNSNDKNLADIEFAPFTLWERIRLAYHFLFGKDLTISGLEDLTKEKE